MRLLFLGDVVGRSGRRLVTGELPRLIKAWKLDFVALNGENAAAGFGITEAIYEEFIAAGADVITLGNHSWDQREAMVFIERAPHLLRPLNYPAGTPGRGSVIAPAKNGARVYVANLMGRVFMDALDDPFATIDRDLAGVPLGQGCDAILVDMHCEATSEKQAMGHYLDGRASVVVGTHTHVPAADARILSGGTAFITDVGMCGPRDSVIGVKKELAIEAMRTKLPVRFEPSEKDPWLCAVLIEGAEKRCQATAITPIQTSPRWA